MCVEETWWYWSKCENTFIANETTAVIKAVGPITMQATQKVQHEVCMQTM